MSGERYTNGLMEGMLLGRAEVADSQAERADGEKRDAYLNAAKYARLALIEYAANGDSDEVRRLTGLSFDWTDAANAL
jgi:hypothetical protein